VETTELLVDQTLRVDVEEPTLAVAVAVAVQQALTADTLQLTLVEETVDLELL
jgi:hypothetical protein